MHLVSLYFMIINTKTKLCGIIGYPIEHSMSPAIHNAAARYYNLNVVFLAFSTKDAKGAITAMRSLDIIEWTVTMPLKEKVLPYLDKIQTRAAKLKNVNTIINDKGKLIGYNTDIDGIEFALKGLSLRNKPVLLLGAGGVAKTAAYVVDQKGGTMLILNRDLRLAKKLAKLYQASSSTLDNIESKIKEFNPSLIINATPVGMGALINSSLIPKNVLTSKMVVFDLIYNPAQTKLLKQAKQKGCKTINGLNMFLGQGAKQFKLWSRKKAPIAIMKKAFYNNFSYEQTKK